MAKKITESTDKMGVDLKVGDYVAYPCSRAHLGVGSVVGFTPKMIRVKAVGEEGTRLVLSGSAVKLYGPDVVSYVLKNNLS